jgi:hypothetical protein
MAKRSAPTISPRLTVNEASGGSSGYRRQDMAKLSGEKRWGGENSILPRELALTQRARSIEGRTTGPRILAGP